MKSCPEVETTAAVKERERERGGGARLQQQLGAAQNENLATETAEDREARLLHDIEHHREQVFWLPLFF